MEDQPAVKENKLDLQHGAMSLESVVAQVTLIQNVMKKVMRENEHYGTIPGTPKPTLYKPGAEKLSLTFRLSPHYEISRSTLPNAHREYEITCTLTHIPTSVEVGQGVGSCSTMESNYRYRKAEPKCPSCGKEKTIIKGKKEYGGGWVCYRKAGGCGLKYNDNDPEITNLERGRVEYDNPADHYNTVLKMAKKRAHVDAILTVTAASDIFTQDLEDMIDAAGKIPLKEANGTAPRKKSSRSEGSPPGQPEKFHDSHSREREGQKGIFQNQSSPDWTGFWQFIKENGLQPGLEAHANKKGWDITILPPDFVEEVLADQEKWKMQLADDISF